MIKLVGFIAPIISPYSGTPQPFKWQYQDESGKYISRKQAKKRARAGEQVIHLYNPIKFAVDNTPKQDSKIELPEVSND